MSQKIKVTLAWALLLFLVCTVLRLVSRFASGDWQNWGTTIWISALFALLSGGNFWLGYTKGHSDAKEEATEYETETKTE